MSTGTLSIKHLRIVQNKTWSARSHWRNVGIELGILKDDLDAIDRNKRGQCEDCYSEVLSKWLKNDPRPTWNILAEALKSPTVCMTDLAEQLII